MRRHIALIATLLLVTLTACGKKITVKIDGKAYYNYDKLYLIVNEDTANAVIVPTKDGRIDTKLKVEKNDFIRISIQKNRMESERNILIADSRHITVDLPERTCEGSPMSTKLQEAIRDMEHAFPRYFHIDVFSDNPEDHAKARAQERAIRAKMEQEQATLYVKILKENADNVMPAWLVHTAPSDMLRHMGELEAQSNPVWAKHPILKAKKKK